MSLTKRIAKFAAVVACIALAVMFWFRHVLPLVGAFVGFAMVLVIDFLDSGTCGDTE